MFEQVLQAIFIMLYVGNCCFHMWPLIKMKNLQLSSQIVTVAKSAMIDLLFHMIQLRCRLIELLQSTARSRGRC